MNRVLKKWYEQRIREETDKNLRLKVLHDGLVKVKDLREFQSMRQRELEAIDQVLQSTPAITSSEEPSSPTSEGYGEDEAERILGVRRNALAQEVESLQGEIDEA